jgi:hypothetical protein
MATVTKRTYDRHDYTSAYETEDVLWIPSTQEVYVNYDVYPNIPPVYAPLYNGKLDAIKNDVATGVASSWTLRRSSASYTQTDCIEADGRLSTTSVKVENGICLSFCLA